MQYCYILYNCLLLEQSVDTNSFTEVQETALYDLLPEAFFGFKHTSFFTLRLPEFISQ